MVRTRWTLRAVVAVLAMAACPHDVIAQTTDTTRTTSAVPMARSDSARADTIQPRLGRDRSPASLEIGGVYTYTREEFFASGALTLTDLLTRLPGVTTFQSGWIQSPQMAAVNGDLGRVRIFLDGIEMDELERRQGGITELGGIPVWALEQLTITRGANELRVDIRTWEYNRVTPYTRFDVYTGDVNTTIYRGFYGKRFFNGTGLQFAGERYNVSDQRIQSGGDRTSLFGRYGIARAKWSLDATILRSNNTRTLTQRFTPGPSLAPYRGANTTMYLRAALGREGDGPFLQLLAVSRRLAEASPHFDSTRAAQYEFPPDTADTLTTMKQFVATAGFDRWGGRLRLTSRYRRTGGEGFNTIGASFDLTKEILALSASAENDAYAGFRRVEAMARVQPLPFLAVSGAVGQRNADADRTIQPTSRSARLDVGIRPFLQGPWIIGGLVTRDTALLIAPTQFDTSFSVLPTGTTTGTTLALRGPLAWGFSVDGAATRWRRQTGYVPEYEAWGELRFFTQWLAKFPKGNFSFTLAPRVDYRAPVRFPTSAGPYSTTGVPVYSVLVELRILRGVITFQRRNLNAWVYDQIPSYLMPRSVNVYGARWYFFD